MLRMQGPFPHSWDEARWRTSPGRQPEFPRGLSGKLGQDLELRTALSFLGIPGGLGPLSLKLENNSASLRALQKLKLAQTGAPVPVAPGQGSGPTGRRWHLPGRSGLLWSVSAGRAVCLGVHQCLVTVCSGCGEEEAGRRGNFYSTQR